MEPLPPRRAAPSGRRKGVQAGSFRGSKSRNKVSVGEPAEGSLTSSATQEAASVQQQQQQQQRHHHCHRRRRSRGRRRRRCRKRHLSVPVQLERRVNGRERASEPADQARFGGWGFLGRATPCSHWAARRCSSSSSSSISRSRWLAGWLASHPRGALGTAPRPLLSPPSPGIWEEAEPKSLCQPRLGHRGLRGERRRRAQQLCEPVRVFGAVGYAFSQGAGSPPL